MVGEDGWYDMIWMPRGLYGRVHGRCIRCLPGFVFLFFFFSLGRLAGKFYLTFHPFLVLFSCPVVRTQTERQMDGWYSFSSGRGGCVGQEIMGMVGWRGWHGVLVVFGPPSLVCCDLAGMLRALERLRLRLRRWN